MSVLTPMLCLTGRHRPVRRDIEWNGATYVTQCRHCGKAIERVAHRNWVKRKA